MLAVRVVKTVEEKVSIARQPEPTGELSTISRSIQARPYVHAGLSVKHRRETIPT